MAVNQLLSPEQSARLSILRAKSLDDTITLEEMQEVIILLRQGRQSAQAAADSSKKKAKAAIPDADSLLNDL